MHIENHVERRKRGRDQRGSVQEMRHALVAEDTEADELPEQALSQHILGYTIRPKRAAK